MPWKLDPILQSGGDCGALMRTHDWTRNPLGPPACWSPELRTVVGIALGSNQPMLIVWGPEQTTLYNDGYARMCGQRHPAAFGRPFRELWFDIWETVEPIITAAYAGVSTSMDDIEFLMHRNGYPEETHFSFSYTPVRSASGEVLGMFCACAEITDVVINRREQDRERARWRSVFEVALGAVAVTSGPDHVFTFANDAYRTLVGARDLIGKPIAEALPEVMEQGFGTPLDDVYRTGEPHVGKGVSVELQRAPGLPAEPRILDFICHPLRVGRDPVQDIFVQALDVTEQHVVNRELAHRLKNQLAVVQAIVGHTLRSAPDLATARETLGARLAVLGRAHDVLLAGVARGTTIREIVLAAVSVHDDGRHGRFEVTGPDVAIAARPSLSLSLIVHELLTNAIKYGALQRPGGQVHISWGVAHDPDGPEPTPALTFVWREIGGPQVTEPGRAGTGTKLIRTGLAGARHTSVTLAYEPGGLVCTVVADLESIQVDQ